MWNLSSTYYSQNGKNTSYNVVKIFLLWNFTRKYVTIWNIKKCKGNVSNDNTRQTKNE